MTEWKPAGGSVDDAANSTLLEDGRLRRHRIEALTVRVRGPDEKISVPLM